MWFIILFFIFYSFNITGFKIGNFWFCDSCLKDEPIDLVFWVIYLIGVISFIFIPNVGQWILLGVFVLFQVVQIIFTYRFWFKKDIKKINSYNDYFSKYHHIIKASDAILIPDTFHICLFIGFLISLIHIIFVIIN